MKYIKKDLGSFGLHLIHTDKLKTMTVRVVFHTPIKREEITKRAILADILLQSSKKYDSKRSLTIEAEELYACDIATNNQRLGNYVFTSFHLQVLNDRYTEKGNFEKAVEFLSEIIFHPDVEEHAFRKDKLDLVKYNTVVSLSSIKEDSTSYSMLRMAEAYDKDSPVSYRMIGYLEDLEKITEENLYESYLQMIDLDYADIFVVGDFEDEEMLSIIKKYFKFKKIKKEKASYFLEEKKPRKRRLFAKETIENTQSKLSIACPIAKLTPYERDYVLPLANFIFGGGSDSKLFKEVREANSLCYTIRSISNKFDQLMIITAGIDRSRFHKTVELISELMDEMRKGHFSENDIHVACQFFHTSMEEMEEDENRMIREVLSQNILGLEPMEERIKKMNTVRKQDIVKLFKKIQMDTVFLLEGVKNEED